MLLVVSHDVVPGGLLAMVSLGLVHRGALCSKGTPAAHRRFNGWFSSTDGSTTWGPGYFAAPVGPTSADCNDMKPSAMINHSENQNTG